MSTTTLTKVPPAKVKPVLSAAHAVRLQRACTCGGTAGITGECEECRKKKPPLQRSATGAAPAVAPPIVSQALTAPGQPLDTATRSFMEAGFGHDFSQVRIHDDATAAASAQAVNAQAYTVGSDIVFDHGQYRPQTPAGSHLLAHELAHTVQQAGMQRSARDLPMGGALDSQLEREAETAARAVAGGRSGATVPSRTPGPILSRAAKPATEGPDVENQLEAIGVEEDTTKAKGVTASIRRFVVKEPFPLPAEKGPYALKLWQNKAAAGSLEAIIELDAKGAPAGTALKQERDSTAELGRNWLNKVGWNDKATAEANWRAATGSAKDTELFKAGGKTCDLDHIVELQVGGTNIKENIQVLDLSPNRSSGGQVRGILAGKAREIGRILPGVKNVVLHYDNVAQEGNPDAECGPCCKVEGKATAGTGAKTEVSAEAAKQDTVTYPISAGGSQTTLQVAKEMTAPAKIYDSPITENKSAAKLISGLLLLTLHRKNPKQHTICAAIDTRTKSAVPLTLRDQDNKVPLLVAKDGGLTLQKPTHPNIAFTYPKLSKGTITKLKYDPQTGLSGEGKLRPSIPFLSGLELGVAFGPNELVIKAGLDPKKIRPPLPGAKVTKAELALALAPEFNPSGTLAFEYAPGGKKVLDATLEITKDANGLVARGTMHAYIPGVDQAEGQIVYQNHQWSGGVKVESTQIKLKYIKSGSVTVSFNEKGVQAEGKVVLDLPRSDGVEVSLERAGGKWLFRGKGTFKVPPLDPIDVHITYDGEHLTGSAKTGFTFKGLKGSLDVHYRDEKFSGKGRIDFKKGRADGHLLVKLSPQGKFSGEGEVRYKISENLIATAGLAIDENEKVTLKGALEFPKPIRLFEGVKGDKEIFKAGITIPIPGVSIGPVGLVIKIDGRLGARYGIGPGELRNAKILATLNPLEDNPDLDLQLGALLYIPAYAGIYGSIRGAIAIDAKIASVSGGLTVTASANLDGKVQAGVQIHYQKSRFSLDALAQIDAGLVLGLNLDADVTAQAGIGPFSVETKKVWNLAAFKYDTGLKFGMKAPLHYASDEPFKAPSLDQIEWVTPDINVSELLEKVLKGGGGKESQAGG
jgi:hypothetical protein